MGGVVLPGFLAGLFVLLPFLDREQEGRELWFTGRGGRILTARSSALTLVASILLLSINVQWGWIHQWLPGTYQWLLMVINPGTVLLALIASWSALVLKNRIHQNGGPGLGDVCADGIYSFYGSGALVSGPQLGILLVARPVAGGLRFL